MSAEEWKQRLRRGVELIRSFARKKLRVPLPLPRKREKRLGLALGGGFARGLAHIGVLKVLEENGVKVHCVAGTSVGSIIAGAYAGGATIEEMTEVARKARWKDFARWTFSRLGFATNHRMEAFLKRIFRSLRFEDLKIPLAVAASDLTTGQPAVFTSGELVTAVRASCAYPGFFLPVECDGCWLVDGMLVAPVPTEAVKEMGADIVVAVLLDNFEPGVEPKNVMDVLARSFTIAQKTAAPLWKQHADIVVEPEVRAYRWDDFENADRLIAAGEAAMRQALPQLRHLLEPASAKAARGAALDVQSPS
jgi:NTE family protein